MTMRHYANKGWLQECRDRLAGIKTQAGLIYEAGLMEQAAPSWVTDETINKLRRFVELRRAGLQGK